MKNRNHVQCFCSNNHYSYFVCCPDSLHTLQFSMELFFVCCFLDSCVTWSRIISPKRCQTSRTILIISKKLQFAFDFHEQCKGKLANCSNLLRFAHAVALHAEHEHGGLRDTRPAILLYEYVALRDTRPAILLYGCMADMSLELTHLRLPNSRVWVALPGAVWKPRMPVYNVDHTNSSKIHVASISNCVVNNHSNS